jgi:hypothetical protein
MSHLIQVYKPCISVNSGFKNAASDQLALVLLRPKPKERYGSNPLGSSQIDERPLSALSRHFRAMDRGSQIAPIAVIAETAVASSSTASRKSFMAADTLD